MKPKKNSAETQEGTASVLGGLLQLGEDRVAREGIEIQEKIEEEAGRSRVEGERERDLMAMMEHPEEGSDSPRLVRYSIKGFGCH